VRDQKLDARRESGRLWSQILPLVAAATMLLLGFWLRWANVQYDGLPNQDTYNQYAFDRFAYSDIASLFYRDNLHANPWPYFDYRFEYPVGMGLLVYLINTASTSRLMPDYFLLTSVVMAIAGLTIVGLMPRFRHGRAWLVALSPALALYVNLNWDMWGVLLTIIALLLFAKGRDTTGGIMLAAAVWTKFFPIVLLPLLLVDRVRHGRWRAAGMLTAAFTLASLAINAPLFILQRDAWLYFFQVNQTRGREVNLWNFFDRWGLTTQQINTGSAILLSLGLLVVIAAQWRGRSEAWMPACCAMLAWFFFINKVYSPQYSLWIVVLLAASGGAPALVVAWSAADLIYFWSSFVTLGQLQFGDAAQWFYQYTLMPAMALREGMLLLIVGWCLARIWKGDQQAGTEMRR